MNEKVNKILEKLLEDDYRTEMDDIRSELKLVPEYGTRASLENARKLKNAGWGLEYAVLDFDTDQANYSTIATFSKDGQVFKHTFKGFSIGYGGEGPRGTLEFGKLFDVNLPEDDILTRNKVADNSIGWYRIK